MDILVKGANEYSVMGCRWWKRIVETSSFLSGG